MSITISITVLLEFESSHGSKLLSKQAASAETRKIMQNAFIVTIEISIDPVSNYLDIQTK